MSGHPESRCKSRFSIYSDFQAASSFIRQNVCTFPQGQVLIFFFILTWNDPLNITLELKMDKKSTQSQGELRQNCHICGCTSPVCLHSVLFKEDEASLMNSALWRHEGCCCFLTSLDTAGAIVEYAFFSCTGFSRGNPSICL